MSDHNRFVRTVGHWMIAVSFFVALVLAWNVSPGVAFVAMLTGLTGATLAATGGGKSEKAQD